MSDYRARVIEHHAPLIAWWDLTEDERGDFDYLETDEERMSPRLVRATYARGTIHEHEEIIDTADMFETGPAGLWVHLFQSDSFFTATAIVFHELGADDRDYGTNYECEFDDCVAVIRVES